MGLVVKGDGDTPGFLKLVSEEDRLFREEGRYPRPFAFNHEVARVFDDMVERSIPLYRDVTRAAVDWACRYYQDGSYVFDLGCSTGTTLEGVAQRMAAQGRSMKAVGIDDSPAMLARAERKLKPHLNHHEVYLRNEDARKAQFRDASVVIINYTLQFLPVACRGEVLHRVYQNLRPGGVLFLSDKVSSCCPEFQESMTRFYESFKESQGYSRDEIARKKEALDDVLVPLSYQDQMDLVGDAGFRHVEPAFKWNNFLSLVALKK